MKKKLYYTIEKETIYEADMFEECTGLKTITVYEIENNEPKKFCVLNDVSNSSNTKEEIQEYLDDNGYGDDEFEFILL